MAKKKLTLKKVLKFFDDMTPSKENANISKGAMRKRKAAKRKKKKGIFG